eukprot:3224604-Amphidinium_carterae.1
MEVVRCSCTVALVKTNRVDEDSFVNNILDTKPVVCLSKQMCNAECDLDRLPEEKHMHKNSVYCRSVALDKAKGVCVICCKGAYSCGRCQYASWVCK